MTPPGPPVEMDRARRVFYTAVGLFFTNRAVTVAHRALLQAGRGHALSRILGHEIVLLTTVGRRTGRPRSVPLLGTRDGEAVLVVGSNAGKPNAPAWLENVRVDPRVTVALGSQPAWAGLARLVDPVDDPRRWALVSRYPGFALYRSRTARPVPLVVIEPAAPRTA